MSFSLLPFSPGRFLVLSMPWSWYCSHIPWINWWVWVFLFEIFWDCNILLLNNWYIAAEYRMAFFFHICSYHGHWQHWINILFFHLVNYVCLYIILLMLDRLVIMLQCSCWLDYGLAASFSFIMTLYENGT